MTLSEALHLCELIAANTGSPLDQLNPNPNGSFNTYVGPVEVDFDAKSGVFAVHALILSSARAMELRPELLNEWKKAAAEKPTRLGGGEFELMRPKLALPGAKGLVPRLNLRKEYKISVKNGAVFVREVRELALAASWWQQWNHARITKVE